jgi:hypothetical protein
VGAEFAAFECVAGYSRRRPPQGRAFLLDLRRDGARRRTATRVAIEPAAVPIAAMICGALSIRWIRVSGLLTWTARGLQLLEAIDESGPKAHATEVVSLRVEVNDDGDHVELSVG